ncbi:uncharacterized protein BT62DRAFT_428194 [Guyanagaster necrorhizus]|uniref:Uncharacterized protein n=1 Tax=Guyanagaster necrorhizus TaxID=856835 RepID=A0A9P7W313_9AGAR|nr:uncharacterized protein BT62DRAFT_428194 [Guyanagaster necrorhizus MCA 3950]KAG7451495.1 hypothetical protein BT62DRAFT_428194 [Guyanagaster necrorhizus MCA 3950]
MVHYYVQAVRNFAEALAMMAALIDCYNSKCSVATSALPTTRTEQLIFLNFLAWRPLYHAVCSVCMLVCSSIICSDSW